MSAQASRIGYLLLIILAFTLFVWGAERQAQLVNTDMNRMDQDAYRDYTIKLAESHYTYTGDRNRMPIYPLFMSLFHQDGMAEEQFFALAKQVNIGLTVLVLGATFYLFRRYASALDTLVAVLVAAFTMFVYKAPFFQAETLFYGLSFGLFMLMLELIRRPRWPIAAVAGVVGGLAHLTKASVLPAIGLCVACLCLRMLVLFFQRRANANQDKSTERKLWRSVSEPLVCAVIFLVVFLIVLFPYIQTSKARFGHYFYNVNSTFYMWYDSWDEVKAGTRAHGDRTGWPDMPAEQLPSMGKYLREHTARQIGERFWQGLVLIRDMTFASYGYAFFLLLYLFFVALVVWQNRVHFIRQFWHADRLILLFFVCAYFGGYLLSYAWYIRIAYGNRFVLTLFLPALFMLVWVLAYAQRQHQVLTVWRKPLPLTTASYGIACALVVYLVAIFPHQIATMFGGF